MNIGFDAKRIFFNGSGLGNYSRSTVELLSRYRPDDRYVLFSPRPGNRYGFEVPPNAEVRYPSGRAGRAAPSLWRSYGMASDIRRSGVAIYHGLSNELPADIRRSGARSVVTVHDLIFVRMPELYKPADRWLYTQKYRRSCRNADRIVAISLQTRDDLVNVWRIAPEKIDVVYQGCSPIFYEPAAPEQRAAVRAKYHLPERYILSVGTIEERKNLMLTVRAMAAGRLDIDLVACGRRTPYADRIEQYAREQGIAGRVHLLSEVTFTDLPALYQMSAVMVYASFYEGFGIPILEGLNSGIPVITSAGGVFPETGGDAALYVDPYNVDAMADALQRTLGDESLRNDMIRKGHLYAQRFREERIARDLTEVYHRLL